MLFNNEKYKEMVREYHKEYTHDLKTTSDRFYASFSLNADAEIRHMLENGENKATIDLADLIGMSRVMEYVDNKNRFISRETDRGFRGFEIANELCCRVNEKCDGIELSYKPNDKGFYDIEINATKLYFDISKEEGDNNEKEKEE